MILGALEFIVSSGVCSPACVESHDVICVLNTLQTTPVAGAILFRVHISTAAFRTDLGK
jgi:hypothetical protein